jgi:hypothetical protein
MHIIGEIEKQHSSDVTTSFHPGEYRKCPNNKNEHCVKVEDPVDACRFLPCHYFDYIGGTSTGGLVFSVLMIL